MVIVPLYSAFLALMFLLMSVRVIRIRREAGIPLGTSRNIRLLRAARAQANFAEYVPLALILLGFVETAWTGPWVHTLGLALVAGRISHAYGVSQEPEDFRFRVAGMAITFAVLAVSSVLIIVSALPRLV